MRGRMLPAVAIGLCLLTACQDTAALSQAPAPAEQPVIARADRPAASTAEGRPKLTATPAAGLAQPVSDGSAPPRSAPSPPSLPSLAPERGTANGVGGSGTQPGMAPSRSPAAGPLAPPRKLIIPTIHVEALVERVGVTPDGAMDVPKRWQDVGWFAQGYLPGEPGAAVIAGHLDSTTGPAVFWDLRRLKAGDRVLLEQENGSQVAFQVASSETYPYNRAPLERIFGPSNERWLNLVTCDGVFDRQTRNYDRRLVVYTKALLG